MSTLSYDVHREFFAAFDLLAPCPSHRIAFLPIHLVFTLQLSARIVRLMTDYEFSPPPHWFAPTYHRRVHSHARDLPHAIYKLTREGVDLVLECLCSLNKRPRPTGKCAPSCRRPLFCLHLVKSGLNGTFLTLLNGERLTACIL